jgi:dihydroxy-acid dehydratase
MTTDKRRYSSRVVDGLTNAPARAMLRAVGFTDADFTERQVGIASTGSALTPCNVHINALADAARWCRRSRRKAIVFHTITVADGISMAHPACAIRWCRAKSSPIRSRPSCAQKA